MVREKLCEDLFGAVLHLTSPIPVTLHLTSPATSPFSVALRSMSLTFPRHLAITVTSPSPSPGCQSPTNGCFRTTSRWKTAQVNRGLDSTFDHKSIRPLRLRTQTRISRIHQTYTSHKLNIGIPTHTQTHTHTHMHTHTHAYIHTYTCTHTYARIHTHIRSAGLESHGESSREYVRVCAQNLF